MPHYKDGTLAQVGDIVKGGDPEITGMLLTIMPGTDSCNVQVACFETREATAPEWRHETRLAEGASCYWDPERQESRILQHWPMRGTASEFELIYRQEPQTPSDQH